MKKILSTLLVLSVFLTGCTFTGTSKSSSVSVESTSMESTEVTTVASVEDSTTAGTESTSVATTSFSEAEETKPNNDHSYDYMDEQVKEMNFRSLSDPNLLKYMEGAVYQHLVDDLGKDVCVDNVSAVYLSQEFIDELTYNSKSNVFALFRHSNACFSRA